MEKPRGIDAQAIYVEGIARDLLRKPDWTQTNIRYAVPYGSGHELELYARTSNNPFRKTDPDSRDIRLNVPHPTLHLSAFSIELNRFMRDGTFRGLYSAVDIADVPQNPEGIEEDVIQMVHDAIALKEGGDKAKLRLDSINRTFAETLAKGTSNYRHGIKRTLNNGSTLYIMGNTLDGEQRWEDIEKEPEVTIWLRTDEKKIVFERSRNGRVETFVTDQDLAKAEASVVGEENVIKTGEQILVFDIGENRQRKEVIEEMERVVGMREPKKEHLDPIEEALIELAA